MNYPNYPYGIFDMNQLVVFPNQYQQVELERIHRMEQEKSIIELRKATRDYCEAARKITSDYQVAAMFAVMDEVKKQAEKDGMRFG